MSNPDWLSIDYKACSPTELVALIEQLSGGEHEAVRWALKSELVSRLRSRGMTNQKIIDLLLRGVTTSMTRAEIAKEWAPVFVMTVREFKENMKGN